MEVSWKMILMADDGIVYEFGPDPKQRFELSTGADGPKTLHHNGSLIQLGLMPLRVLTVLIRKATFVFSSAQLMQECGGSGIPERFAVSHVQACRKLLGQGVILNHRGIGYQFGWGRVTQTRESAADQTQAVASPRVADDEEISALVESLRKTTHRSVERRTRRLQIPATNYWTSVDAVFVKPHLEIRAAGAPSVPLSPKRNHGLAPPENDTLADSKDVELGDVVENYGHVIVHGDAGAGKTTLLKEAGE